MKKNGSEDDDGREEAERVCKGKSENTYAEIKKRWQRPESVRITYGKSKEIVIETWVLKALVPRTLCV